VKLCKEIRTFDYKGKPVEATFYFYRDGGRRWTTIRVDTINYWNVIKNA